MKRSKYEKELFEAYIATPEKFEWYQKAFDYFESREGRMSWYWNNWAFLGGVWYLLYRKQMKWALIILFAILLLGVVLPMHIFPFVLLFIEILIGGFGTFFIYRQYKEKRKELESILSDKEKRILVMHHQIGGVSKIVIPMAIVMLISFVLIVAGLLSMADSAV